MSKISIAFQDNPTEESLILSYTEWIVFLITLLIGIGIRNSGLALIVFTGGVN